MTLHAQPLDSPVGQLTLLASETALIGVLWPGQQVPSRIKDPIDYDHTNDLLSRVAAQLREHFSKKRTRFDLPIEFRGSEFQKRVWKALRAIPYGKVRTYRDIAVEIGQPTATRAVGAAIGQNLLSIVVPCHRVIGSSGHLTGFAGGLPTKEFLLTLESRAN